MSGDPEQEYFADGLAEDIITELSRFREFAVIARNSTFFYKGKPLDVTQVARDLKVRYVLEGSVRKIGNRVRVTAQLIDAADKRPSLGRTLRPGASRRIRLAGGDYPHGCGKHRPADRACRDRPLTARHDEPPRAAARLARREVYTLERINGGNAALMQQAIAACEEAITADPSSLAAHFTLARAHWICHLYRWGDRPDGALDRAWAVVERMTAINSQDERTLTVRGLVRVNRGEYDGGLADLRRAYRGQSELRVAIIALAFAEATTGLARGGGSTRPARAATQSKGLLDRNRPPRAWQWRTSRCAITTKPCAGANPQSRFRIEHRSAVP